MNSKTECQINFEFDKTQVWLITRAMLFRPKTALTSLLPVLILAVWFQSYRPIPWWIVVFTLMLGMAAMSYFTFVRNWDALKGKGTLTYVFYETGFRVQSEKSGGEVSWDGIRRIKVAPAIILIYPNKSMVYPVPRKQFSNDDLNLVLEFARRKGVKIQGGIV